MKQKTDHLWEKDPVKPFADFVTSIAFVELGLRAPKYLDVDRRALPLSTSSATIYRLMFGKFARWMTENGKTLYTVSDRDIMAFLDAGEKTPRGVVKVLNSRIRLRYLRLLERVFAHLDILPNPAQGTALTVYKTPGAAGREMPMVVLTADQEAAFLAALPVASHTLAGWKRRRDRAMQALMLGAGLKVSEALVVTTDALGKPDDEGALAVKVVPAKESALKEHQSRLRPFAVAEVLGWAAERRKLKIPGKLLFPASLEQGEVLDKATVYRQVKKTFQRAKLPLSHLGGRTLRNTFAIRELQSETVEQVQEMMGHHLRRSTEDYLRIKERLDSGGPGIGTLPGTS